MLASTLQQARSATHVSAPDTDTDAYEYHRISIYRKSFSILNFDNVFHIWIYEDVDKSLTRMSISGAPNPSHLILIRAPIQTFGHSLLYSKNFCGMAWPIIMNLAFIAMGDIEWNQSPSDKS